MRNVETKSNTNAYVIIRNLKLGPYQEEIVDVDEFILSELKSFYNLAIRKSILISDVDREYVRVKIESLNGGSGGGGTASYVEVSLNEDLEGNSIPFSTLKDSSYMLGNPDKWLKFDDDVIVPAYTQNRIE